MKLEVANDSVPCIPSVGTYSRRLRSLFTASPFSVSSTSSCATSAVPSVSYQGPAEFLRLSRDERSVAIASQAIIKVFDLSTGRMQRQLPGHGLPVRAMCPKRTSIYDWVSGSLDGTWAIWDMRCHPAKVLDGRAAGPVRCVDVSPDDTMIAIGTDNALQLWDVRRRQALDRFPAPSSGVVFCPTEKLLASYGAERVVRFWCLDQMSCIGVSDAFSDEIRGLSFAGLNLEDDFLVACTDSELRVITYEPCDTLMNAPLPRIADLPGQKVLELTMSEQDVALVVYGGDNSLCVLSCPVEDTLTGNLSIPSPHTIAEISDPEEHPSPPTVATPRPISSPSESPTWTCSPSCSSGSDMDGECTAVQSKPPIPPTPTRGLKNRTPSIKGSPKVPVQKKPPPPGIRTRTRSPSESSSHSTPTEADAKAKSRATSVSRIGATGRSASPADRLPVTPKLSNGATRVSMTTQRSSPSLSRRQEEPAKNSGDGNLDTLLSKFDTGHAKFTVECKKRTNGVKEMRRHLSRSGAQAVVKESAVWDPATTALLLSTLNSTKSWDLQQIGVMLPHVKDMLSDGQEIPVVLESLNFICTSMLSYIRSCAKPPGLTIGVDVAADERREIATGCLKVLVALRDGRDKLYNKMKLDDAVKLDAVIGLLKAI